MFLFDRIDFVALVGLWVQAFVAWVFVAILGALRQRESSFDALRSFRRAFLALAVSLSILSVRFFSAHDPEGPGQWYDGEWPVVGAYMAYLGLKVAFGLHIVRGCYELAGRNPSPLLARLWWPAIGLFALAPLAVVDITPLLIVQAPAMIACAQISLRALRRERDDEHGLRLVRLSLRWLLGTWCLHAVVASLVGWLPALGFVLSLNSLLDLAVQLMLGIGLVVSMLQASHRRMRAAERERERLERELARDEKLRALGTLVSGVAHELNNPLTVILGYAELLSSTPQAASTARIIEEQAERCRGIVRNLSALAGHSAQSPEDLNVAELVERVVRGLTPHERAQGKQVVLHVAASLQLCADRIGLEQVLSNLIANAFDASPSGAAVTVSARRIGAGVEFRVADQGPGVPAVLRERLFEPFFTTKRPGQGMGLGLAIAHAIVRGHGGSISVEDGPDGRGAIFCVFVPDSSQASATRPRQLAGAAPARSLLVLDDDSAVRSVLRGHAERRGWRVSEFDCAEAALTQRARLAQFDVVLCDLRMPGMGGVGFHDRLASEDAALLARTVFATGDLASTDAVRFSQRCQRPLVQKPFVFDELFDVLETCAADAQLAPRPR